MYDIKDLFDKRSVVGADLEKVLEEHNCTKAKLCRETGVSRPTIDKLISGDLTSKTNYEKHITKVLDYFEMTPDMLLGSVVYTNNRTRIIRNLMKITSEEMSKRTGLPLDRLRQIESGEEATLAELRDVAFCLSISVNDLTGENFFEPQVSELDDFIGFMKEDAVADISGFWGHVGILLNNTDQFIWFPITTNTRSLIYDNDDSARIVIPCMNNRVLLLNMSNVKEILTLDDACDAPDYANWDHSVSCGEIPLVVYEALDDYIYAAEYADDEMGPDVLSVKLKETLKKIIKDRHWSNDDLEEILFCSTIYYSDGRKRGVHIDFTGNESISDEISNIYCFGDCKFYNDALFFHNIDGSESIIQMKNIAMMELPLLNVETAIQNGKGGFPL